MRLISFAIPVFRNQGLLKPTYEQIRKLFEEKLSDFDFEIVFVDDGSDDGSLEELIELNKNDKRVKVISFSKNFGQVAALTAGLNNAKGDCTVIMSADLQDPVEVIEQLVNEWKNNNEIVIAYRADRDDGFISKITSKIFYSYVRMFNPKIPTGGFDYCLLDRVCVVEMNKIFDKNRFFQGDVLSLGFNVKFVPYNRVKRLIGKSQWTFSKKMKYFIDGIITSSYIPVRFMSFAGFVTALIGFVYGLIIVYGRLINNTPFNGWAPIMILILIIGGMLMIMMGIIGEYIWRIYDEVKKKPNFIIKKKYME